MLLLCYNVIAEAKGILWEEIVHKDHKVPFYFKKVAKETILLKQTICPY